VKVIDLNGKIHTWNLKGYQVSKDDTRPRSDLHLKCRELLNELFPLDIVCEEVPLLGEQLFLDFFLPSRKFGIEVQGNQHTEYVPFFHKTKDNFYKSVKRDKRKEQWCLNNNIKLVILNYDESESEWRAKILGRNQG